MSVLSRIGQAARAVARRLAALAGLLRDPRRRRAAIAVGALAAAALSLGVIVMGSLLDIRLRRHQPSVLLLDRTCHFLAEIESPAHELGYWPMPDTVPRALRCAVLAAEDRRFAVHPGVDLRAIARAFVTDYVQRTGYSGASTIAMQTARLQRGGASTCFSKARDALAALWLTAIYGRERILRQYLTIAPYGNRIAGAAYAARRYFQKPVRDLSLTESALLVSVPRAPSRMNLFAERGFSRARLRARLILKRCAEYGWISGRELTESLAELTTLSRPCRQLRDDACLHAILTYERLVRATPPPVGREPLLTATIDLTVQRAAEKALALDRPWMWARDAANAAVMVLDKNTAEVLAYVGSGGYADGATGAIDHGAIARSTGSLLKPFIYGLGMEEAGCTAATVLTDVNFDFGAGRNSFIPQNCDRAFLGPVLYKTALANSRNVPAVQVLKDVGIHAAYRRLVDLRLTPDDGRAGHYGLGLSIGGLYCDLRALCRAYLALGNRGRMREPVWFPSPRRGPESDTAAWRGIMPPDVALMIQRFLADPLARVPSFPRGGNLEYPFPVAVKTGTSEGYRDSWCIAWSDRYLVGVWMGNADNHPMKHVSGYEGAAPLVKQLLCGLHPDRREGLNDRGFPLPKDYTPVRICSLTGLLADRSTPFVTEEYFRPGTEPCEYSRVLRLLPIDTRNGLLAVPGCADHVECRQFLVMAPRFEEWAEAQGLPVAPRRWSTLCGCAPVVDDYALDVVWPRSGSRFFADPEMPPDQAYIPVQCRVAPDAARVVWFVNGVESAVTAHPHRFKWPMRAGRWTFQAGIPGTPLRSRAVAIEVF